MKRLRKGEPPRFSTGVDQKGFSLFELLIVLSIVTVLAAVAVPLVLQNVPRYKLKGAARTLVNDFQKARVEAVKRNRKVEIRFSPAAYAPGGKAGSYQIVEIDVVSGDPIVPALLSRQMPEYVTLCDSAATLGYNSQGLPSSAAGSVYLMNNKATYYRLALSSAGHVSLDLQSTPYPSSSCP